MAKTTASASLLGLPSELRTQIWNLAFLDTQISSFDTWRLDTPSDCEPCLKRKEVTGGDRFAFTSYETASQPLFTCKQVFNEASPILHGSLILHVSEPRAVLPCNPADRSRPLTEHCQRFYRNNINDTRRFSLLRRSLRRLTLYVHLDDFSRYNWITALGNITNTFPSLTYLTVHNHMRPPISYDNLVDAIYLAGPLCTLRPPLTITENLALHLAYCKDEVMFEAEFLGPISTADSIDEHSLVIRELFEDSAFVAAARDQNLNEMTGALLVVARTHERRWIQGLHRRRFVQMHVDAGMEQAEAEALVQREWDEAEAEENGDGQGGDGGDGDDDHEEAAQSESSSGIGDT